MSVIVVSYGMGTNSTALLCGLKERGIVPHLITTADTGGERPDTYAYSEYFSEWCMSVGFPPITVVRRVTKEGRVQTLEELSLAKHMLPSLAYGFKSCSLKFKVAPQDKYLNHWQPAVDVWNTCTLCGEKKRAHRVVAHKRRCADGQLFVGGKVTKLIGYDAGEERRAKIAEDDKYVYRYPLIEWGWGREECVAAIKRAGLELPGKSACFFCPSMKKPEIVQLRDTYPDLMDRALKMETNAELISVKGLGRRFSWGEFIRDYDAKRVCATDEDVNDIPCGCYDDGAD